jgi:hypothetical protein
VRGRVALPAERAAVGLELLADLEKSGAATLTSLTLPTDLPWEQYESLAFMLGQLHRTSAWLIGDLLNFGEKVYGETYAQAAEATGLSPGTLQNYTSVCSRIPRSRRRAAVPFSTHAEVAYKEPEEQEEWLNRAEQQRWTKAELRAQMRHEIEGTVQNDGLPKLPPAGTVCPACGFIMEG